jgi:hypothetical protein
VQTELTTLTNNLPAAIIGEHKHLVFDLDIIAKAAPMQYVALMHLYYACLGLEDHEAPEEDYVMANEAMIDLEERVTNGGL